MNQPQKSTAKALIGGKVVPYDRVTATAAYPDRAQPGTLRYLGKGTVHSIDGVAQTMETVFHFWRKEE